MKRTINRTAETVGMLMIGDGVLGLARPTEHCLLWQGGPGWWRDTVHWFAAHPAVTRAVAVTELSTGLWLALRQEPKLTPVALDLTDPLERQGPDASFAQP